MCVQNLGSTAIFFLLSREYGLNKVYKSKDRVIDTVLIKYREVFNYAEPNPSKPHFS